jgi:hypothetical protein
MPVRVVRAYFSSFSFLYVYPENAADVLDISANLLQIPELDNLGFWKELRNGQEIC